MILVTSTATAPWTATSIAAQLSSLLYSFLYFHSILIFDICFLSFSPSSSSFFDSLETQMFCSFEEECGAGPNSPNKEHSSEVTFFEESILAKKNRSALSYKAFTPFLSDTR